VYCSAIAFQFAIFPVLYSFGYLFLTFVKNLFETTALNVCEKCLYKDWEDNSLYQLTDAITALPRESRRPQKP